MTALFIVVAICCVMSVAYTSYRLGKEDGWQAGVEWAIRNRTEGGSE